jgi:hypothetical protein
MFITYEILLSLGLFIFILIFFLYKNNFSYKKKKEQLNFEKSILLEKEKELSLRNIKVEHENIHLKDENKVLFEELTVKKSEEKNLQIDFFEKSNELVLAKKFFEEEKKSLKEKEELKSKEKEGNIFKEWSFHEQNVISKIKNICKNYSTYFTVYDNKSLPENFDLKIKPDILLEFNNRYIVFDAKKSKNINTYVSEQIKLIPEKYSNYKSISKLLFFVIPNQNFIELNKSIYEYKGFTINIISVDCLSSSLFLLKRLSDIEKLSNLNPEEQDVLIESILQYQSHISIQNSVNIFLAEESFKLNKSLENLPNNFLDMLDKKEKIQIPFSIHKIKSMAMNKNNQNYHIKNMKKPKLDYSLKT